MNVFGKIFTVLILVMALVSMAVSLMVCAACPDWRSKVMSKGGLKEQLDAANKEKTDLSKEKLDLEAQILDEKERYVRRLAALENEKTDLLKVQASHAKDLAERETAITKAVKEMGIIHESIQSLFAETGKLEGETKTIIDQRRKTFEQAVRLTDELLNAVTERLRLAKLGRELQSQLARMAPATNPVALPNHN